MNTDPCEPVVLSREQSVLLREASSVHTLGLAKVSRNDELPADIRNRAQRDAQVLLQVHPLLLQAEQADSPRVDSECRVCGGDGVFGWCWAHAPRELEPVLDEPELVRAAARLVAALDSPVEFTAPDEWGETLNGDPCPFDSDGAVREAREALGELRRLMPGRALADARSDAEAVRA
jgi:hypothetical protein